MRRTAILLVAGLAIAGCNRHTLNPSQPVSTAETATPVTGQFSADELQKFHRLDPVDTHVHIYQTNPAFLALLEKLNLHVLNIIVPRTPDQRAFRPGAAASLDFRPCKPWPRNVVYNLQSLRLSQSRLCSGHHFPGRSRFFRWSRSREDLEKHRRAGQRCKG